MGSEQQSPTGPDLSAGIDLSSLEEGRPVRGRVADDDVMVVRVGDEIFALGAACTHYGGPLAEGIVTGETIRCPWHHACFSLRTGAAVAAPALNPLARWRTRVEGGVVFVTEREPDAAFALPARAVSTSAVPASVVIIGAGAAGHAAAETLRREAYAGRIVVIDPDASAPYDRPNLSKDYLAGEAPEEWIPLRPAGFYEEHGIERIMQEATSLDTVQRTITLADATTISYDALLLATGATPIRLRIPGVEQAHVHVLRSLEHSRALIAAAMTAQRVVIAGASFIGMEAAASLRHWGLDVTVVAPETVPFGKVLGDELGGALRALHEEHGVHFHLGRTISEIGASDVVLDDGSRIAADLVLLGVGVRPVLGLAESAGLAVDNGVLVDSRLRSSIPSVFVAGDSARYPDPHTGEPIRIEHWVVAQRQGQTAARNILGHDVAFTSVPFFWTRQYDVAVNYVGHAARWTHADVDGDPRAGDCRITYRDGAVVRAVATINRDRASLEAEVALEQMAAAATTAAVSHAG